MPFQLLPPEAIQEFKELYRLRYGIELSDEEASFRANNLVRFYELVLIDGNQHY